MNNNLELLPKVWKERKPFDKLGKKMRPYRRIYSDIKKEYPQLAKKILDYKRGKTPDTIIALVEMDKNVAIPVGMAYTEKRELILFIIDPTITYQNK